MDRIVVHGGARLAGTVTVSGSKNSTLALMASARGLKEARAAGKPLEKVEVLLATAAGETAAHFEVSPDDADALLNGRISPSKYFVTRVIF